MRSKLSLIVIIWVVLLLGAGTGFFAPARGASVPDLGLIEAAALKGAQSRWVVLDGRQKSDWEAGHIPGAHPFSWDSYKRTDEKGVEYRTVPPKDLAQALGALGIDENTPLVVYGDADKSWGGEGWDVWVLSWLGHKGPIRLLNGGIQAWRNQGFPLVKDPENRSLNKLNYRFSLRPELDISTEELDRNKGSLAIVDVRGTLERLKGKIPGSIHIPWEDFYAGSDRRPLAPGEVKKLLLKHKIDPSSRPMVFYCLGGVRSAYAWLVYQLAGLPTARNYEGGMAAWQKRANR